MKLKRLLLVFAFFSPLFFYSQAPNPVKWDAKYTEGQNNEGTITLTATIDEGWHIYSQKIGNDGPIPTSFVFSPGANFALEGKAEETGAKEEFDKAFEMKLSSFEKTAVFTQKIKRSNLKTFISPIKIEYMTCNGMQCLPPKTIDVTVSVPAIVNK